MCCCFATLTSLLGIPRIVSLYEPIVADLDQGGPLPHVTLVTLGLTEMFSQHLRPGAGFAVMALCLVFTIFMKKQSPSARQNHSPARPPKLCTSGNRMAARTASMP